MGKTLHLSENLPQVGIEQARQAVAIIAKRHAQTITPRRPL